MTKVLNLPSSWLVKFDGDNLDVKLDVSAVLATSDASGRPYMSYLSAGEIFIDPNLRVALTLWPSSHSAVNIGQNGYAVLHAAAEGAVWEARLSLRRRTLGGGEAAVFDGVIEEVRRHAAPYAEVDSLVVFRLHNAEETLARWTSQVERMRSPVDEGQVID